MTRRLSGFCAAFSLLICLAASVACFHRQYHSFSAYYLSQADGSRTMRGVSLIASGGGVAISTGRYTSPNLFAWMGLGLHAEHDQIPTAEYPVSREDSSRRFVFKWHSFGPPNEIRAIDFVFPAWSAALTAAALPLIYFYRFYRRTCRRSQTGYCAHCGYDLRATPERCPECGTPVTDSSARPEAVG